MEARPDSIASASERRGVIPCMDGVRGFACLLVLVAHSVRYFMPRDSDLRPFTAGLGKTGILIFFVLSGFMMMYHYHTSRQLSARYWYAFAIRRFFRIYPAYVFTVLLFCLFSSYTHMHWGYLPRYLFLMEFNVRTHLWSIPPEITFYLLFPLLSCALFILPVHRHGKLAILCATLFTLCLIPFDVPQTSVIGNLKYFLAGMLAAYLYLEYPLQDHLTAKQWNGLLAGCFAVFIALIAIFNNVQFRFPNGIALIWGTLVCILMLTAGPYAKGWAGAIFIHPFVRYCGTISYSLYLIHPLIIFIAIYYLERGTVGLFVTGIAGIILSGIIMHTCIEKPSNAMGKKLSGALLP